MRTPLIAILMVLLGVTMLLLVAFMTSPARAFGDGELSARPAISAVVIDDDGGGVVGTFIAWYTRLKDSGVQVRLRGICMSACGLVLMLPPSQVCVEPTASIGFHLAADSLGPDETYTAAMIRRYFPPVVRAWLADKTLTLRRMVFLDADEMVELGVFPACNAL
jgi:hypothetical protein